MIGKPVLKSSILNLKSSIGGPTMTQEVNGNFNPFDPTGMLKTIRDANMETWSKMMIDFVNTDAYARLTTETFNAALANSMPFRKMLEVAMTQALANLNMPSRAEFISLAERLTNIEMKLYDMDAKLDECLRAARRNGAAAKNKPRTEGGPK
jgi:hypothetical protein